MGSNQMYQQKMMADMQTALAAVQVDMGTLKTDIASLILKMNSQITELQNVVSAVGASTPELLITNIGANAEVIVKASLASTAGVPCSVTGDITMGASGNFLFVCSFVSTMSRTITINIVKNGSSTVLGTQVCTVGTFVYTSVPITVAKRDVVKITLTNGDNGVSLANGKFTYKVHNLITSGPFIL